MKYSNLKALIDAHLDVTGHSEVDCYPGPQDPSIPGSYILLTRYGGPGLNTEALFDGVGYQVKVVSEQYDFDSGEEIALVIDRFLLSLPTGTYHGERTTHFQRVGGSPAALLVDDANRHHFVCSYVADVQSGVR